ncbi:TPA: hypothetical protein QB359_000997 [Pasteurella multocida]|nr:hypothetical protein [Pasteurella multocida]
MQKEWFTAFELEGKGGLPTKATNITRKATKENWEKRQVKGKKGIAFEYHYSSLPEATQKELGFKPSLRLIKNETKPHSSSLDLSTLQLAIETLEEALEATDREISTSKKATLIVAIYDLLLQENNNKEPLLKLIRSIA